MLNVQTREEFVFMERLSINIFRFVGVIRVVASRYVSSFFSALAAEQMMQYRFHDNDDRKAAVEEYIEFYNEERIHSSLGYKTPREVFTRNHFRVVDNTANS